ncbi:hypothetical protein HK101_009208 [Irineochytrium annulatum]|nr:hypothetical protein HK101_009208 [Irineochytrium annulatum]
MHTTSHRFAHLAAAASLLDCMWLALAVQIAALPVLEHFARRRVDELVERCRGRREEEEKGRREEEVGMRETAVVVDGAALRERTMGQRRGMLGFGFGWTIGSRRRGYHTSTRATTGCEAHLMDEITGCNAKDFKTLLEASSHFSTLSQTVGITWLTIANAGIRIPSSWLAPLLASLPPIISVLGKMSPNDRTSLRLLILRMLDLRIPLKHIIHCYQTLCLDNPHTPVFDTELSQKVLQAVAAHAPVSLVRECMDGLDADGDRRPGVGCSLLRELVLCGRARDAIDCYLSASSHATANDAVVMKMHVIQALVEIGDVSTALAVLNGPGGWSAFCFAPVLHFYASRGDMGACLEVHTQMRDAGVEADMVIATILMHGWLVVGQPGKALEVYESWVAGRSKGRQRSDVVMATVLMTAYATTGNVMAVEDIVAGLMRTCNVDTGLVNFLVAFYLRNQNESAVRDVLLLMTRMGIKPDEDTVRSLVGGLVHMGRPYEAADMAEVFYEEARLISLPAVLRIVQHSGDMACIARWADRVNQTHPEAWPARRRIVKELACAGGCPEAAEILLGFLEEAKRSDSGWRGKTLEDLARFVLGRWVLAAGRGDMRLVAWNDRLRLEFGIDLDLLLDVLVIADEGLLNNKKRRKRK